MIELPVPHERHLEYALGACTCECPLCMGPDELCICPECECRMPGTSSGGAGSTDMS